MGTVIPVGAENESSWKKKQKTPFYVRDTAKDFRRLSQTKHRIF
jgi:hypothetical protein